MKKRSRILDFNFEQDMAIDDFTKQDLGNNSTFFSKNWSKMYKENQAVIFVNV